MVFNAFTTFALQINVARYFFLLRSSFVRPLVNIYFFLPSIVCVWFSWLIFFLFLKSFASQSNTCTFSYFYVLLKYVCLFHFIFGCVFFFFSLSWFGRSFTISSLSHTLLNVSYWLRFCSITCVYVNVSPVRIRFKILISFTWRFRSKCLFSFSFFPFSSALFINYIHISLAPTQNTFIFYLYLHRFGSGSHYRFSIHKHTHTHTLKHIKSLPFAMWMLCAIIDKSNCNHCTSKQARENVW